MMQYCARSELNVYRCCGRLAKLVTQSTAYIGVEADVVEDESGNLACSRAQKVSESPDVLGR